MAEYHISGGKTSTGIIIGKNDSMYVHSGGMAIDTTLSGADYSICGTLTVYGGGTANNTTVNYGRLYVSNGGTANNTTVNFYSYLHVSSGGTANNTTVNDAGFLYINSGGVANAITADDGAQIYVSSGGSASIKYNPWGNFYLSSEYGANVTYIRDAGIYIGSDRNTVSKTNKLNDYALNSGYSAVICSGGTATDITIKNGGVLSVESGGIVSGFSGEFNASSGAIINGETCEYDYLIGHKLVSETTTVGGAFDQAGLSNYMLYTEVYAGASAYIDDNVFFKNTRIHSGGIMDCYGEVDSFFSYYHGFPMRTEFDTLSIENGGELIIGNHGIVSDGDIKGMLTMDSSSNLRDTVIHSGGIAYLTNRSKADNITVGSKGTFYVAMAGQAENITIDGGTVHVATGGIIADVEVVSGGKLFLYGGAILDGTINIRGTLCIGDKNSSFEEVTARNASITFDLAQGRDADDCFVDNISKITGDVQYSVTVAQNLDCGTYTIASGAENFDGAITISNGSTDFGTVSLENNSVEYQNTIFTLSEDEGNLMLEYAVVKDVTPPEAPTASADITTWTTKNITVKATFADDSVKNEYSVNNGAWSVYTAGVVFSSNGNIRFRSTDIAGNVSDITTYTVSKIDKTAPTLTLSGNATAWTNGNVTIKATATDNASGIKLTQYSLDNKTWQTGNSATVSANGTVYFKTTDNAGNVTTKSETVSKIDKTAPTLSLSGNATAWTNGNVTIKATATDSASGIKLTQYSLDNKTWKTGNSVTLSANGTVYFKTTDNAGNVTTKSETVSKIDKTAPTLSLSGNATAWTNGSVTIKATVSDNASGIKLTQYSLDNKTWKTGSSVTVTENGTVWFKVTDNAGNVTVKSETVDKIGKKAPDSNLLKNGVSQIVAWDKEKGAVGFAATDGTPGQKWRGVWDWDGKDAELWRVVGVGHFKGSTVDHDGILLYNGIGTTFAAWTNLNDPSYGYVNLCHVEGNFNTKCLTDLDSNQYDDVLIYDEKGSIGVVLDGAIYKDIWHVDDAKTNQWTLRGAGNFGGKEEKLVVENKSGHLYLWQNNDTTFKTWNWSQTAIGYLGNDFEFVATGDFMGDGIDDILVRNTNNGGIWMWDNGDSKTAHWEVTPGKGFKAEAVGDYNGDGKDDLLVREYNTGWGGMGYYAFGSDKLWNDLNDRIETDLYSKFAVIA